MNSVDLPYPASPALTNPDILKPSPAFKKQVLSVLGAIVLFFAVYLLLLLLATGLAVGCMIGGVAIITGLTSFLGLLLGAGLIGTGLLVLFFLIKFIFSVSKFDRSGSIEITEQEQPALFAFIRRLAKETGTQFPKRIYVSADVNACVFYDSSFWSMFFPVRKNLQIGLGLVNTINLGEFKAVVAHEFGHFSQSSMKLGSFVYQVNRIIHNMLFDNQSYAAVLNTWANLSGVFQVFARITVGILNGIQWILRNMYGLINKKYMGLSREMEFHADAVAASVSGGNNLATALRRVEISQIAFQVMIDKYNELWKEKKRSGNAYPDQLNVLKKLAKDWDMKMEGSLPVIQQNNYTATSFSRINFKDQWASHPATEDRIAHLESLHTNATTDLRSPWTLFSHQEKMQAELTSKLYETVKEEQAASLIDSSSFEQFLNESLKQYELPREYNGFYDGRKYHIPDMQEWDQLLSADNGITWTQLFTKENGHLNNQQEGIRNDMATLDAISNGQIDTKTFDFDGIKYGREDIPKIKEQLEQSGKAIGEKQQMLDRLAMAYFLRKARAISAEEEAFIRNSYAAYQQLSLENEALLTLFNNIFTNLQPIYAGQTIPIENIRQMIHTLKTDHEPALKKAMNDWMEKGALGSTQLLREKMQKFIQADYAYFSGTAFFEAELAELYELSGALLSAAHAFTFGRLKNLLEFQLKYKEAE